MPNTDSTTTTGPQPVPVGLFLAAARRPRTSRGRGGPVDTSPLAAPDLPDWNGLSLADLAYVIRRYTRAGDVVLDLDRHPSITAAAHYLHRTPARLVTSRHGPRVRLLPPPSVRWPRRVTRRPGPGTNLILLTLPRTDAYTLDLHGMAAAMTTWRRLLRPGGHLLTALTAHGPQPGRISHRATVIAAARAAGLLYHQHIPVVLIALPEHEPRTETEPLEDADHRRLLAGRHLPTFHHVLAFASTATGEENGRA